MSISAIIKSMKVILGLGNPDQSYNGTRHNIGFSILDTLASKQGILFQPKQRFFATVAETTQNEEKILLVKPTTYYNETGNAARALIDFYKLTLDDILIIHDDSALDFGKIRVRHGGSDGGNNGLKSLHRSIGQDFWHIRIGTDSLIHRQMGDIDFVLGKFNQDEKKIITSWVAPTTLSLINSFLTKNLEATSYKLPTIEQ